MIQLLLTTANLTLATFVTALLTLLILAAATALAVAIPVLLYQLHCSTRRR